MPKKRSLVYRREGSSNWYIKGLRISTGTDNEAEAEALATKLAHEQWLQDRMGVKPPRSWKEAVLRWLKEKGHKVSINTDIGRLKWLDQHLGSVEDLNHITRDRVDAIMLQRKGVAEGSRSHANATANKYVGLIAGILNAAEREWEWGNRAPRLRYYKEVKDLGRSLTPAEFWALYYQLSEPLQSASLFAVSTGMRSSKVFTLRWDQIANGQLSFLGEGNKLGNTIPLNKTALGVLQARKTGKIVHKEFVFNFQGKPVKGYGDQAWWNAVKRAGIDPCRFHDLRHTFNSWLAQQGVPMDIRKRLVGHKTSQMNDRYTHLDVEHLRPYSALIDTFLTQWRGQDSGKALRDTG